MEFEGSKFLRVAVVGPPNAGKSVLVNRLVGTKVRARMRGQRSTPCPAHAERGAAAQVSAVSPKCNTTRQRVLGVLSQGDTQVCFTDTPGVVDRACVLRLRRARVRWRPSEADAAQGDRAVLQAACDRCTGEHPSV